MRAQAVNAKKGPEIYLALSEEDINNLFLGGRVEKTLQGTRIVVTRETA